MSGRRFPDVWQEAEVDVMVHGEWVATFETLVDPISKRHRPMFVHTIGRTGRLVGGGHRSGIFRDADRRWGSHVDRAILDEIWEIS